MERALIDDVAIYFLSMLHFFIPLFHVAAMVRNGCHTVTHPEQVRSVTVHISAY